MKFDSPAGRALIAERDKLRGQLVRVEGAIAAYKMAPKDPLEHTVFRHGPKKMIRTKNTIREACYKCGSTVYRKRHRRNSICKPCRIAQAKARREAVAASTTNKPYRPKTLISGDPLTAGAR